MARTSISVDFKIRNQLDELKVSLEEREGRKVSWNEFFELVDIQIPARED